MYHFHCPLVQYVVSDIVIKNGNMTTIVMTSNQAMTSSVLIDDMRFFLCVSWLSGCGVGLCTSYIVDMLNQAFVCVPVRCSMANPHR